MAYHCANFVGDFFYGSKFEMLVHHLVTLVLIASADILGWQRIGTLVLFVHDVPDIFAMATRSTSGENVSGLPS